MEKKRTIRMSTTLVREPYVDLTSFFDYLNRKYMIVLLGGASLAEAKKSIKERIDEDIEIFCHRMIAKGRVDEYFAEDMKSFFQMNIHV